MIRHWCEISAKQIVVEFADSINQDEGFLVDLRIVLLDLAQTQGTRGESNWPLFSNGKNMGDDGSQSVVGCISYELKRQTGVIVSQHIGGG